MGTQLDEYLKGRYKVKTKKKQDKKFNAGTLAGNAYAKAMSNFFEVY